jgi:hypothetical protein
MRARFTAKTNQSGIELNLFTHSPSDAKVFSEAGCKEIYFII